MIEKSVALSQPVDPELLERIRFYLPYLCDPILSLEIVSGARPEIRYTCAEESSCALIEAMAHALLGQQEKSEQLNPHPARAVFDNRTADLGVSRTKWTGHGKVAGSGPAGIVIITRGKENS